MSLEAQTGHSVRLAARSKALTGVTSGFAPSYLQANLLVLPERYAADFRLLCARNPVPCPLLAESASPGSFSALKSHLKKAPVLSSPGPSVRAADLNGSKLNGIPPEKIGEDGGAGTIEPEAQGQELPVASDIDLRHDFPQYRVYTDGALSREAPDIEAEWAPDHVGFLIGCSYSFESALEAAGLPPRHTVQGRNVPMYRTSVPLCPAGVFRASTYVVSMRPYRAADVERVRNLTRPYVATHGEPLAWGWDAARRLGIADITRPEWGDPPLRLDGSGSLFCEGEVEGDGGGEEDEYVPVFWGCGVTPQEAVMRAGLEGTVMAHAPGHMIVLDVKDGDVFPLVRT